MRTKLIGIQFTAGDQTKHKNTQCRADSIANRHRQT